MKYFNIVFKYINLQQILFYDQNYFTFLDSVEVKDGLLYLYIMYLVYFLYIVYFIGGGGGAVNVDLCPEILISQSSFRSSGLTLRVH